jgi:hypothetical protein
MEINEETAKQLIKELLGASDIAELFGWDVKKVSSYKDRSWFPSPIGTIGGRPVWLKSHIEAYAQRKGLFERMKKAEHERRNKNE